MKIVHVWWSLGYGGIETMLVNIANKQSEEGAQVTIIIIDKIKEYALRNAFHPSVNVICLNRTNPKCPLFIIKFNYWLWKICPDVVHLHQARLYRIIWSKKLSHVACVTLHDLPHGTVRHGGALRRLLPIIDIKLKGNVGCINEIPFVFAISNAVKKELQEKYGIDSVVVNNGILTSNFAPCVRRTPSKSFRLVQVSRLEHDKKGQDLLIEAVARIKENVEVDFIGVGGSMEYLEQLAKDLKVESRVHFLGSKTQQYIAENLCQYDLFVQPSRYEGFGLTVAEAMAAKVPVLVSAGQGPAEVTCGDKYGWMFNNGNVDDMVEKINYIIEHYNEAITKADKALMYVRDIYDVSATANRYLREYKTITTHGGGRQQLIPYSFGNLWRVAA